MENFIPVKVDRTKANTGYKECDILCFPRSITLDISYYQVDKWKKRIIEAKMIYEEFDKDPDREDYEFKLKYYPLVSSYFH